ncbi:MAG: Ig-like domain-containing protein [Pyrinomonadaceae bacterium]
MSAKFFKVRRVVVSLLIAGLVTAVFFRSSLRSEANDALTSFVPIIGATKSVAVVTGNADAEADPGETLEYTVTINNTGPDPATGVAINDTLQNITTLVGGSTIASPVATNDTFSSIGNVGISVPAANGVFLNDLNPNGSGTLVVQSVNQAGLQGLLSLNTTTGAFDFTPNAGFEGSTSFIYTLGNGTGLTDTATVTINVTGMIWFVNANLGVNGDGRLGAPFNSLANFNASPLDEANDNIFLFESATGYSGGVTLLASQKIIGQDATATLAAISGVTVPPFSNPALPAMNTGGNATTLTTGGINVSGGGNTVRGMTISNTATAKINGTNFGTLTVGNNVSPDVILSGGGKAIDLNNGSFSASSAFTSVATTSSTSHGMQLITVGGTVAFGSTNVSGSASQGIFVNNSSVNLNFGNTTVGATTAGEGVRLETNTGGTLTFGTLSITNSAVQGFTDSGGGNTSITGATTITNPANVGILIQSKTAGTSVTFANVSNTQSGSHGVQLANNAGTVSFADLDIAADANQRAFLATNNTGTITTSSGTISDTGTATAVEITNASGTVPLNMQLTSVSANGAANGIVLTNTSSSGAPGGFRILGAGTTDGSGGTIQNTTTRGASFTSASNVSLQNMNFTNAATTQSATNCANLSLGGNSNLGCNAPIHIDTVTNATLTNLNITGSAQQGINGRSVTNFVLSDTVMSGIGQAADEDGIHFLNMIGTCSITNTSVTGSFDDNMIVQNLSGTSTLTITGSTFSNSTQGSGILFGIRGGTTAGTGANSTINITGATQSTNNFSGGIVADTFEGSTMVLNVTNSTSSGNNDQISVSAGDNSNVDLNVNGNTLSSVAVGDFGVVNLLGSAFDNGFVFDARVQNNNITVANGLIGDGIFGFNAGGGQMNMLISGNTIDLASSGRAIAFQAGQDGAGTNNLTVTGNTIDIKLDGAGNAITGILAQVAVASPSGDNSSLCSDIGGTTAALRNTITHSLGGTMAAGDIRVRQRFVTTHRLRGYGGANNDNAAVVAYLAGRNTLVNVPTATATNDVGVVVGAGGYVNTAGGAPCAQPIPRPAPPAEESAVNTIRGFDNKLSFLNTPFGSGEWRVESGEFGTSETWDRAANTDGNATVMERASDSIPQSAIRNPQSAGTLVHTHVSALIDKLGEIISPTVYAQKEGPPKAGTSNAPESGETVTKSLGTLPAGESIVVKFRATVDNGPYASGVNNITNTATISGSNFAIVNSTTSSIALDAAPDLVVTKTDGGGTTQPGVAVVYTLSYSNTTATNGQNAANVVLTETVPANTTFNATASLPSVWSCANGSAAGTSCTISIGSLNDAASGSATFAVNVLASLPAGVIQVSNTSSIAENPNVNGTDRNAANNTGPDTTNIIGNWLGGTSTDWFTAANWSNGVVPPAGNNVSVPNVANQPIVTTADVTLNNMNLIGENVTINAGRTITVNGVTTLGANNINGAGTLNLGTAATITRTTGQVECTMIKNFGATGLFTFPVGTTGAYSPVDVNVTAGAGQLSVKANTGTAPLAPIPLNAARTLQRYWTLSGSGITSNITFNYLNGDVPGPPNNENIWNVIRVVGGTSAIRYPAGPNVILDAAANTFTLNGVQVYSDWTAGEPLAPTASSATVAGRVFGSNGRGVYGSFVSITDANGNARLAITNPFGYYSFAEVQTGQSYVISVRDKRHQFAPRVMNVSDDLTDVNFTPIE